MPLQVLLLVPSTEAHNWFQTPARALFEASTVKPCRGRKASDTHAQVGPGQTFTMKWTAGHEGPTFFLIVHESDENHLQRTDLPAIMEEYMKAAPEGTNTHMDPHFQRYHGTPKNQLRTFVEKPYIYDGEVKPGDANYLDHPRRKTESLWKFQDDVLAKDFRVSYLSEKYPWIEVRSSSSHACRPAPIRTRMLR